MKQHCKQNPTLALPVGKQISRLPILSLGILMTRLLASVSKIGYQAQASTYILLFVAYFCGINTQVQAQNAYIPNSVSSTVSVVNTATNTITATVSVGFGNSPRSVSVSPDGSKCYVANYITNKVSIINTATNTVSATVSVGTNPQGVAVSPDGSKCYVANSGATTVSIINTATNTVSATISVGSSPIGVSFSPDGSKCYVANGANTVSVINTATNTVTATISVGSNPQGVFVSPDGSKCYITNNGSNTVSIINTATNTVSATVSVGANPVGISVSPDGSKCYVVNSSSNTVSVINTATNTVTATVSVGVFPYGVSVSPDGSKCYVGNINSGTVSVINTTTNTVSTTISGFPGPFALGNMFPLVYPPVLNLSQTTLTGFSATTISASASQTFTISGNNLTANASISVNTSDWELSTDNTTFSATLNLTQSSGTLMGQPITVYVRLKSGLTAGSKTATLTASSTGATNQTISLSGEAAYLAYIPNYASNTVSVVNTATNTITATISVGANPVGVSVSPDGSKCYVVNYGSNTVSVINTATNTVTATVSVEADPNGIAVSPDGSKCYVTNYNANTVSVINTATNTVSATVSVGTNPLGVAFSPDGFKCYVTNTGSNTVSVINTATNTVSATISVGANPLGVAVSPDGSKCYVANNGTDTVSVIDTATNTVSATIIVGTNPFGVVVSPDGSKCYVANTGSNTVSVINTTTNTVSATVSVGAVPWGISVSPDGSKCYVANNAANTVSVINTATNTVSTTITGFNEPIALGNMFPLFYPPVLNLSQTTLTGFVAAIASASASQTFTISGIGLTANASISVNTSDWELSTDNSTFSATLNLAQSSGTLTGQPVTVYVRLKSGLSLGAKTATLTASSTGATNQTITLTGNAISSTPSPIRGNSLSFNKVSNHHIMLTQGSVFPILDKSTPYTIEGWIKTTSTSNEYIYAEGSSSNVSVAGIRIDGGGKLNPILRNSSNTFLTSANYSTTAINDGLWHHFAFVRSDASTVTLYIDGKQDATDFNFTVSGTFGMDYSTLGALKWQSGTESYINAGLDEFRVWNTARTQAQIRSTMHLTLSGSETGLAAYYQFNETTGNAIDAVSGNNGVLQNGASRTASTLSVGKGVSKVVNVPATGTGSVEVSLATTQMQIDFTNTGIAPNGDIGIYQITAETPYQNTNSSTNTTSCYWVVQNFGATNTGLAIDNITFQIPTHNLISTIDETTPNNLKLYKRNVNASTAWADVSGAGATSASNTTKQIVFSGAGITSFSEFIIGSGVSALPITLLGLKGERVEGLRGKMTEEVRLTWSTASEINNKGFEVEMSENAQTYKTIAFVDGAGQSTTRLNYQLSTLNPHDAYYRLKQVDFDGKFSYSPIVFVEGVAGKVVVYPNPNNGTFTVICGTHKLDLPARLLNAQGQEVWKGTQTEVRTIGLPTGMYFLHTVVAGKTKVTKVVIER